MPHRAAEEFPGQNPAGGSVAGTADTVTFSEMLTVPWRGTHKQEVSTMAPGGCGRAHKANPGDPTVAMSLRQGSGRASQGDEVGAKAEGRPGGHLEEAGAVPGVPTGPSRRRVLSRYVTSCQHHRRSF